MLPVLLKVLPLKEDREESMAVYSCICNLVLLSNPQVLVAYTLLKILLCFYCLYFQFI